MPNSSYSEEDFAACDGAIEGAEMLRTNLRALAKRAGYQILGYPRAYAAQKSLIGLLLHEQVDLVIDVGANTGQFALELRDWGYTGRIVSFEPQSEAHKQLREFSASDPNWEIGERAAVGAETGIISINISANTYSSSVLPMLPTHSEAEPAASYVGSEEVPVRRLDDLCESTLGNRVFLKIDVQGYEKEVLEGAPHVLESCRALMVEMSLVPLYEGQILAKELWDLLAAKGFEGWALEPGIRDPGTGQMLQFDGLFVRRPQDVQPLK